MPNDDDDDDAWITLVKRTFYQDDICRESCLLIGVVCVDDQSTGAEARLVAEADNSMEAVLSTDAESTSASHLDAVSLSAGKEFINPRGIRFTTASSHRLDGSFHFLSSFYSVCAKKVSPKVFCHFLQSFGILK